MLEFFSLLADFYRDILSKFALTMVADLDGVLISLLGILVSCLFISFVVNVFWKGAKA